MSDFYKWDPAMLSVNVKEMDNEHIELIKRMNALHAAYTANKSTEELGRLVDALAAYTVKHFQDEEAYMEKVKFDGLATHKIIHKQLLDQVTKHVNDFKTSGKLGDEFFKFLAVWLTSHIRGIDTKYGKKH